MFVNSRKTGPMSSEYFPAQHMQLHTCLVTNAIRMGRSSAFKSVPHGFVPALLSKYSACRAVKAVSQRSLLHNLHLTTAV